MKQAQIDLVAFLKSQTGFTDVMGEAENCKIFPLVGNENTAPPYTTYAVRSQPLTKDARQEFATIVLWYAYGKYTDMAGFTDVVVGLLETNYEVGEVYPDYNQEFNMYATIIEIEV